MTRSAFLSPANSTLLHGRALLPRFSITGRAHGRWHIISTRAAGRRDIAGHGRDTANRAHDISGASHILLAIIEYKIDALILH